VQEDDGPTSPTVAVINRRMADRYWPNADPIGRSITFPGTPPTTAVVVGVVGDVKHYSLATPTGCRCTSSQAQQPFIFNSLVVRTDGDPMQW